MEKCDAICPNQYVGIRIAGRPVVCRVEPNSSAKHERQLLGNRKHKPSFKPGLYFGFLPTTDIRYCQQKAGSGS